MKQPNELEAQLREKEREKVAINYLHCFDTQAGQEVLKDLKEMYQDKSSVVADDPHGTYFQEGCRFVYLLITETVKLGQELKSKGE
tara:strand:+ start:57 stop:314 length:258 start_codon:yes stop_codon:yes gene_type:complete